MFRSCSDVIIPFDTCIFCDWLHFFVHKPEMERTQAGLLCVDKTEIIVGINLPVPVSTVPCAMPCGLHSCDVGQQYLHKLLMYYCSTVVQYISFSGGFANELSSPRMVRMARYL